MARYTRKDAEHAFDQWLKATGQHRHNPPSMDVGGWVLDYAPTYGGVQLWQIGNEHGGYSTSIGYGRMSVGQFVEAVRFALDTLDVVRRGEGK
jgi:hypothetical protein